MDLRDLPLFSSGNSNDGESDSSDRPGTPEPKARPITVSELTQRIKSVVEPAFTRVWLQGEISNYRPSTSGHAYFSLKDSGASVSAAIFGWGARLAKGGQPKFDLKDGLQVLCKGKVTLYPPRGTYQLTIEQIEPLGAGALQLAFEQLKKKLQLEGLFDPTRKRALPQYPKRIAIVTSPSGAALQDMLNILGRRAPHVQVVVIPAIVQGDQAPNQIIRGIRAANDHALGEILVLARGGGSIEDLWCFNDERLARAISDSKIPVVSAVGHEIDFTISDFVSDLRAPTPSAAAEIITGHWVDTTQRLKESSERLRLALRRDLQNRRSQIGQLIARLGHPKDRLQIAIQRVDELQSRLQRGWQYGLETRRARLRQLGSQLVSPRDALALQTQKLKDQSQRMGRAIRVLLDRRRSQLEHAMAQLHALSPLQVLDRGFSILRDPSRSGELIRSAAQVKKLPEGYALEVQFADGKAQVVKSGQKSES
jgi:exodeoxyribonuclease VII large subunit